MISTVVLHSTAAKSTMEEPKTIRNNSVRKVTQEQCKASPFFSYNGQNPYANLFNKTNKKNI